MRAFFTVCALIIHKGWDFIYCTIVIVMQFKIRNMIRESVCECHVLVDLKTEENDI